MTNLLAESLLLEYLGRMFLPIKHHNQKQFKETATLPKRNHQLMKCEQSIFKVSFFDGIKRMSCQMRWTDLEKVVDFLNNKLKFERKEDVQSRYDIFLEKMKSEGKSIYNHIIDNEMKINSLDSFGVINEYTICQNKYPYDFGIHQHFLLWIHPKCGKKTRETIFNKEKCYEFVKQISVTNKNVLGNRFIIFRNAPINKSVHTIEHFHVICY